MDRVESLARESAFVMYRRDGRGCQLAEAGLGTVRRLAGILRSVMILTMKLGARDSNSIVVGSAWRVVELYCMLARPPLRRTSAAGGWQLRPTLREQPLTPGSDDTHCTESNQPTSVEVDQAVTTNPTPISASRPQSHIHRQYGCPLRSPPPLRDHGMMRHGALCDREDPMLTRSCSLPYAPPTTTENPSTAIQTAY